MQLAIPFERTNSIVRRIPHGSIKDRVIQTRWSAFYVEPNGQNGTYGEMKAQAVCWLYCWAMNGLNSEDARIYSVQAFNQIFVTQLADFPPMDTEFHNWARDLRYRQGSCENELEARLNAFPHR